MHGPNTPEGCLGCTFATDSFNGSVAHRNAHDVTFVLASRSRGLLDRTPKGRDEGADEGEGWPLRHNEYSS